MAQQLTGSAFSCTLALPSPPRNRYPLCPPFTLTLSISARPCPPSRVAVPRFPRSPARPVRSCRNPVLSFLFSFFFSDSRESVRLSLAPYPSFTLRFVLFFRPAASLFLFLFLSLFLSPAFSLVCVFMPIRLVLLAWLLVRSRLPRRLS